LFIFLLVFDIPSPFGLPVLKGVVKSNKRAAQNQLGTRIKLPNILGIIYM